MVDGAASRHVGLTAATTSGFYETSGIRLQRPKDLWAALSNDESQDIVGMPQIFMIASGRGVELGFAAAIHRSQFSAAPVKAKLKRVVPPLFTAFPQPDSQIARELSEGLAVNGGWWLRERTRMAPLAAEFASVSEILSDIHSERGQHRGSAAISRYYSIDDLNGGDVDLVEQFENAIELFAPIMEHIRLHQHTIASIAKLPNALPSALLEESEILFKSLASNEQDSEVARMARSIVKTVKWSNGQVASSLVKNKTTSFDDRTNIEIFLKTLWEQQGGLCALTYAPLSMNGNNPWLRVSCDRIDSDKGYEPDNMQLTLWAANRFKGAAPQEDWPAMRTAIRIMGLAIEQQDADAA
jgi:hypothetical protein